MEISIQKKVIKYVFPDTNVFYYCKFFTEIDWKSLFPEENIDKIIIEVSYTVLKELDKGKYKKKRARQVLSRFQEIEKNEIQKNIELELCSNLES